MTQGYEDIADRLQRSGRGLGEEERRFETKQVEAQPFVGIRTNATMDKLPEIMGSLFGEVYGYIQQKGQTPAMDMPWNASAGGNRGCAWGYRRRGSSQWTATAVDMECGMPVASPYGRQGSGPSRS